MRATVTVTAAALAILLLPALVLGQEPVKSFDQLNARLKIGDTVWVTDTLGRQAKGRVFELHDASITLDGDSQTTFAAERVREIQHRRRDSVWTGGLIGLGAGAAYGWLAFGRECGEDAECLFYTGGYGALGMSLGLVIDALIPGKKTVAFRSAGAPAASNTRVSLSPVLNRSTRGLAVALSF